MPRVLNDPVLARLLPGLHADSNAQDEAITRYYREERTGPWTGGMEARDHAFMADKAVALDQDKAEFCYLICVPIGAARTNLEAAGLASFIDLREGDIVEATRTFEGPIDFVLFDIWGDVVRPMLD